MQLKPQMENYSTNTVLWRGPPLRVALETRIPGHNPVGSPCSNDVKVPYPGIEAELRAIMAELRKASIEGDVDAIANSISDDYIQTDINGYRQDKKTWLNEYFRPLPT
jgi:hypothetical protein